MAGDDQNHECVKQKEFNDLLVATTKLDGQMTNTRESISRMELSVEKMAEGIQKLTELQIRMQENSIPRETFYSKLAEMKEAFEASQQVICDGCNSKSLKVRGELDDIENKLKTHQDFIDSVESLKAWAWTVIGGALLLLLGEGLRFVFDVWRNGL